MSSKSKIIVGVVLFLIVVWAVVLYGADESAQAKTPPPAPAEAAPETEPTTPPETPPAPPEIIPETTPITPQTTPAPSETTPKPEPTTPQEIKPLLGSISQTYHVLPIFKMSDVLNVEEEQKWDGTMTVRGEDMNKTYSFYKQFLQNYTEKISLITDDQLNFKSERYYSLSRIKSNMPDTGRTLIKTSLEGKTIALECKNYQIFSCEKLAPKEATIIGDDYSYVNSFNWIYFLLPEAGTTLAVGASYPIKQKELGRIIFKEHFNEKSCVISGNGVLEEVTNPPDLGQAGVKTDKTARLLITLKITQTKTDNTIFTADLIGFCKISVNSEPALDLEISGPFNITQTNLTSEDKKISSSADGVLKIKSRITLKK
ncbi:MAG: hypothetical protein V1709_11450 [Planctomycetota bacterium]